VSAATCNYCVPFTPFSGHPAILSECSSSGEAGLVGCACEEIHGAVAGARPKRIIPCLDVTGGVVKGVNFVNLRDAGDPGRAGWPLQREGAD